MEERNAVCMACRRVSPLFERKTFEELAMMFGGGNTSGAERAYRKAVEKLILLLVEAGVLHTVQLQRKSVKLIKRKAPPQSMSIRQTATASGAKFSLILRVTQRRSSG